MTGYCQRPGVLRVRLLPLDRKVGRLRHSDGGGRFVFVRATRRTHITEYTAESFTTTDVSAPARRSHPSASKPLHLKVSLARGLSQQLTPAQPKPGSSARSLALRTLTCVLEFFFQTDIPLTLRNLELILSRAASSRSLSSIEVIAKHLPKVLVTQHADEYGRHLSRWHLRVIPTTTVTSRSHAMRP